MAGSKGLISVPLEILGDTLGHKPEIPDIPILTPGQEQAKSIAGNQAALPGAERLATGVNDYNIGQLQQAVYSSLPDAKNIISTGNSNLGNWERGVLSPDTVDAIKRNSAYQSGVVGGYGGSQAAGDLTMKDLGLDSYLESVKATAMAPGVLQQESNLLIPQLMGPQFEF